MFTTLLTFRARHGARLALLCLGLGAFVPVQAQGNWQFCAVQDEICRFDGQATVRYGVDGKYAYKVARNRIICDHLEFGDPAFGRPKRCEFSSEVAQQLPSLPAQGDWVSCASEGEMCSFRGSARVRYGTDNRYVYRNATNAVLCSVRIFGDPAYGRHKTCDYQLQVGAPSVVPERGWEYCASEGGICQFSGAADVRYGAQGRFVTMRGINGLPCSLETFGRDPIYGQRKQCFVRTAR